MSAPPIEKTSLTFTRLDEFMPLRRTLETFSLIVAFCSLPADYAAAQVRDEFPAAMSPEQSLKAIHVPKGLRVELVAAEPLVFSPVAIDFGPTASSGSPRCSITRPGSRGTISQAAASDCSKTPTATASTTSRRCFSTRSTFPTASRPGKKACWSRGPRHHLRRRHQRRRRCRHSRGGLHRIRFAQLAGADQQSVLRPR